MLYFSRGGRPLAGIVFEFADFKLDCGRFELRRGGSGVRLERKPMELLILLASSEGRLVTRAEIARRLWDSEVFVDTEHGINTAIRKIRTVLGDDPESPRFIQTVTGMGYRFIATVEARTEGAQTGVESGTEKGQISSGIPKEHTSGAKAPIDSALDVPGINPRPTARTAETNARPATRTAETNAGATTQTAETNARPSTPTAETNAGATARAPEADAGATVRTAETNARPIARPTEIEPGLIARAPVIDAGPAARTPETDARPTARAPKAVPAPTSRATPRRSRRAVWIALGATGIVIAALAVALGLYPRMLHRDVQPNIASLAVLPLDNLSGDAAQDYFADGMTDELITMLAKRSTLRVTSRTSVMQYKGAHRPLREIARGLGVDGILEGSVVRSGNNVHLTVQLIQAQTDTHLWAESYDRDMKDEVTLPREVAETIAKKLKSAVPPLPPARYVSPEAHDAYVHGRYLWTARDYDAAQGYLQKAVELQPDYALGWSGLSDFYGGRAVDGEVDPRQALPQMEAATAKAIRLDDSLAEAHLSMAAMYFFSRWDLTAADREILRAIELDPKFAEAYYIRALIHTSLNRHQEAIELEKKAMEIDPFARPYALAGFYFRAREFDAGLKETLQRLESNPNSIPLNFTLAQAYWNKGMDKRAVEIEAKAYTLQSDNESASGIRRAFQQGGSKGVARWRIDGLNKSAALHYVSPLDLAGAYGEFGDKEKALAFLEEAYRRHVPALVWVQCDPHFDFLHSEERYRSLIHRIGLPPAY